MRAGVPGRASVGYWLAPGARGRGLATRAVRLLATWAFADPTLERLELTTLVGNDASGRVALRAGFRREGILRRYLSFRDTLVDAVMYAMVREDTVGRGRERRGRRSAGRRLALRGPRAQGAGPGTGGRNGGLAGSGTTSSSRRETPATPSSCCWRGTSPSAGARDPGKCPSRRSGRARSRARSPSSKAASAERRCAPRRPPASCASGATTSSTCSPGSRPSSGRSWAPSLAGCAISSRRPRSRSGSPRSGPWPRASRTSSTTRPRLPAAASASSTRRSTNGIGPRQPSGR